MQRQRPWLRKLFSHLQQQFHNCSRSLSKKSFFYYLPPKLPQIFFLTLKFWPEDWKRNSTPNQLLWGTIFEQWRFGLNFSTLQKNSYKQNIFVYFSVSRNPPPRPDVPPPPPLPLPHRRHPPQRRPHPVSTLDTFFDEFLKFEKILWICFFMGQGTLDKLISIFVKRKWFHAPSRVPWWTSIEYFRNV